MVFHRINILPSYIALVLIACIGCKSTDIMGYSKAPIPVAGLGELQSQLDRGRATYVGITKCNMCHRPKPVGDYTSQQWTEDILPKMSKKARLSDSEYRDLQAYVLSPSAQRLKE